jgi:hypothetical protein
MISSYGDMLGRVSGPFSLIGTYRHIILQGKIKALKCIQWFVCKKGGFSFDKAIRESDIRRWMFLVHGETVR